MLHLAEETQVFNFLLCMKFHASSFMFMVSDMNKILSFPRKYLFKKYPNIHRETFRQVRQILGNLNYQGDIIISKSTTATKDA